MYRTLIEYTNAFANQASCILVLIKKRPNPSYQDYAQDKTFQHDLPRRF
jgi:hypothetical protein